MNRVAPVIILLRPGRHRQELALSSGQRVYRQFSYLACDLKRLPVDDYLDSRTVVSRILPPLMRYARERRKEALRTAASLEEIRLL